MKFELILKSYFRNGDIETRVPKTLIFDKAYWEYNADNPHMVTIETNMTVIDGKIAEEKPPDEWMNSGRNHRHVHMYKWEKEMPRVYIDLESLDDFLAFWNICNAEELLETQYGWILYYCKAQA